MATEFGVESIVEGDAVRLAMSGDINRSAQGALDAAYESVDGAGSLVLDFTSVDYINSTGIAVIVGVLAKARASGRNVSAVGLTDHYREVFRITRLSDFMDIGD